MHYYKRNIGDYAKKAGRLTMLQHGAYTLLIDSCYDREVFPTTEQALEWTWASTEAEVEAVKFVLSRFFKLDKDGCHVQDRVLEELLNYHKNADTNKRIADEREAKRKESRTKREQSVDEAPPNHKPLTTNQEPITINQEPTVKGTRGSRLSADWVLPKEWADWAKQERPDLDLRSVSEQFRDYWSAKAGSGSTKLDWQATWRNWVRNQKMLFKHTDLARTTVPSSSQRDPALAKLDEDAKLAKPNPEILKMIREGFKGKVA
jgi:uncharacterized protein YdaU (DUF1376 family)